MKKALTQLLLILAPLFASAQTDPPVLENVVKSARYIVTTLKWDDHLNIMQVNIDNDTFELIAVNEGMQTVWRRTIKGYPLALGKLKDKLIAIAATDFSTVNGPNNIYKGVTLDPNSGKTILDKVIYTSSGEYMEATQFFVSPNGESFKMSLRQTGVKRKLHVGMPGILSVLTINRLEKEFYQTRSLTIMDINEALEPVKPLNIAVSPGKFFRLLCNNSTFFVGWIVNDNTLKIEKLPFGQTSSTSQLSQIFDIRDGKLDNPSAFTVRTSTENENQLLYALLYQNANKDMQLTLGRFDFEKKTSTPVTAVLTNDYLKDLKKAYVPVNKDFTDKPNPGSAKNMELRYLSERNGLITVAYSSQTLGAGQYATYTQENALVLSLYGSDLKHKNTLLLPTEYITIAERPTYGFKYLGNTLYVLGTLKSGATKGLLGQIDLASGKWTAMTELPKKHLDRSDWVSGSDALWFDKTVIVPYLGGSGFMSNKRSVSLQRISL